MIRRLCLIAAMSCMAPMGARAAQAGDDATGGQSMEDLLTVSQDDLLDMGTNVTAQSASLREAPGVLTVISRDEILASGARELTDVLHQVAGFSLAEDVQGVTDVGFRGIWGHEGKILLMIDGQELNEPLYATLQLGHHYLMHNVDRIEIIRGPGSVIYGGNAELAVINIISRTAQQIGVFSVEGNYGNFTSDHGAFVDNFAHRSLQLSAGWRHEPRNVDIVGSVAIGQGNRSPRRFRDFYGSPTYTGTQGNADLDPLLVNVGLSAGAFKLRVLFDRYHTSDRYPFDTINDVTLPLDFYTLLVDGQYAFKPHPTLTITPRATVKWMMPWHSTQQTPDSWDNDYYYKQVIRSVAAVSANWDILDSLNLLAGVQGTFDYATENLPPSDYGSATESNFPNGKSHITYEDVAAYAQLAWFSPWVNLTAGGRIERHSAYGLSFVPRVAATKAIGPFHAKALFSEAFRAPSIENIHLNTAIRPEYTRTFELELGYTINRAFYIGANIFDTTIHDPIVYDSAGNDESYLNFHQTGSVGGELELRYRGAYGFATIAYSIASTVGLNDIDQYRVPQTANAVLGLPVHKGTGVAGLRFGEHWVLGPSLVVLGPRYGVLNAPNVVEKTSTTVLANFVATYEDFFVEDLDLSLGVYNFLDQPFTYIQPYNSYTANVSNGRAPIPGLDREVFLRLAWSLE